jgi:lipopolysaccharide heptosyltransferase III
MNIEARFASLRFLEYDSAQPVRQLERIRYGMPKGFFRTFAFKQDRLHDRRLKVLIIAMPALGDILLATPLIRSIRDRDPDAVIDLLIYPGQEGIVEGNPDIDAVLVADNHPGIWQILALTRKMWRKYDIAISNAASDRANFYLWLFSRKRVSVTLENSAAWKRRIAYATVDCKPGMHALLRNNALGALLGYPGNHAVILPRVAGKPSEHSPLPIPGMDTRPYAVLHLEARLPYKRWTDEGWRDVAAYLSEKELDIYVTGGGGERESQYLQSVLRLMPAVTNLTGKLRLAEVSELIAGSRIYVGVDTVASHIAASHGTPSVVLFGPDSAQSWGPWPAGYVSDTSPWQDGRTQRHGNVWIIQSTERCTACPEGSCRKARDLSSGCPPMISITSSQVIEAIAATLDGGA